MNHLEMMRLAESVALQSVCKRAQVGAVVVCANGRVLTGFNHNGGYCCEGLDGRTLPTVLHAEADALLSASGFSGGNAMGAILYVTRQPCINCARLIVDAGISVVYYRDSDDKVDGLLHLFDNRVLVDSRWIDGQAPVKTQEQVQQAWAERSQHGYAVGDVVNVLGVDLRVVGAFKPHPSNLMPWLCDADRACDACPQRGDGVCCGGVR